MLQTHQQSEMGGRVQTTARACHRSRACTSQRNPAARGPSLRLRLLHRHPLVRRFRRRLQEHATPGSILSHFGSSLEALCVGRVFSDSQSVGGTRVTSAWYNGSVPWGKQGVSGPQYRFALTMLFLRFPCDFPRVADRLHGETLSAGAPALHEA